LCDVQKQTPLVFIYTYEFLIKDCKSRRCNFTKWSTNFHHAANICLIFKNECVWSFSKNLLQWKRPLKNLSYF